MKKNCLTSIATVLLLIISQGMQAQNSVSSLDQLKLAQGWVGTWQQNIGKDTVQIYETQQYRNLFIQNVSFVIKGKRSLYYTMNYGFSSKEDKFKGVVFYTSGFYQTWIAKFTSEKVFSGNFVQNFNPDAITGKFENVIETPTMSMFNTNGVKTGEFTTLKVK
jgi:hypothetical protein